MKNKKGLRLFLYALPIVAFGAAAISCFAISSVTKNNFNSNEEVQKLNARIMKIQKDYIDDPEEYTNPEGEAYEEGERQAALREKARDEYVDALAEKEIREEAIARTEKVRRKVRRAAKNDKKHFEAKEDKPKTSKKK